MDKAKHTPEIDTDTQGIEFAEKVSAVVLAAGLSSRMGEKNKLHLPINGEALVRHSIQQFRGAGIKDVVVVLGHEHEKTAELIKDLDVTLVINTDYASGQMTSVHRGLGAAKEETLGCFIALGDQPAVTQDSLTRLVNGLESRGKKEVIVPYFEGKRGNPILLSAKARTDILDGKKNFGCRKFIENNPDLVQRVEVTDAGVITDLDTPQDYKNYCATASSSVRQGVA